MDMPKVLFYNFFEANPPDPLCNLMAQNVLERAFVTSYSDSSRLRPNIMAKSFPYENFYMQLFTYLMIYLIPIFLTLSMFSVVMMIVKVSLIKKLNLMPISKLPCPFHDDNFSTRESSPNVKVE